VFLSIFPSLTWMVLTFDMSVELFPVEVDITKISRRITRHLVTEMRGFGIAALAAGCDGFGTNLRPEFNGSEEAVSGVAIPFFGTGICTSSE